MLGTDVFSRDELARVWDATRDKLLVERGGKAFGILAKDSAERVYYGDEQYHEAVVWPRDTPYLIRLLELLGEEGTVRDILDSNLGHMVEEQAVFYGSELFSLPEGRNPHPTGDSQDPVPVKDPVQFWSQWVDPYLRHP
jgi:glycogen debranching enzyme